jgi:hypothetical protein
MGTVDPIFEYIGGSAFDPFTDVGEMSKLVFVTFIMGLSGISSSSGISMVVVVSVEKFDVVPGESNKDG